MCSSMLLPLCLAKALMNDYVTKRCADCKSLGGNEFLKASSPILPWVSTLMYTTPTIWAHHSLNDFKGENI